MKRLIVLTGVFALTLSLAAPAPAQPGGAPATPPPQGQMPMPSGMCPMMGGMQAGGMMGGGMMSMMGPTDPRTTQMKGEMMKAMGEVMMKYGKTMERPGR